MYGKAKTETRKAFDGEGIVDFEEFEETFLIEADKRGAGVHFRWKTEEIRADGSVPEEEFPFTRLCEPGQEEAYVLLKKNEKIAALEAKFKEQVEIIRKSFTTVKARGKEADLCIKLSDEKHALESGFDKAVNDLRAACDAFDKREKLFLDTRAQAVSLLTHWLGPNPMNKVYTVLSEVGPKNAWKKLKDSYESEALSRAHRKSVIARMARLKFSSKMGKVVDHMAYLDKLNRSLIRANQGQTDDQLVDYLLDSIERSKEAMSLYGSAIDYIENANLNRTDAVALLTRIEHSKDAQAEIRGLRQSSHGAQFATARGEYAGTASARRDKKGKKDKKRKAGEDKSGGEGKKQKTSLECSRCGGDHFRRNCKEVVFCQPCNTDTHDGKMCWKTHPEKAPKFFKRKVGKRN